MSVVEKIKKIAFDLGFHAIGFTSSENILSSEKHFLSWRDAGYAADMNYLLREKPKNARPKEILSEAKSIITLLTNYYTKPPENPGKDYGRIASYAVGLDYHNVLKNKINLFQEILRKEFGDCFISKGFSDSVPLLEKSFSRNAGLGFMGKNTLIINKPYGSYFFLSEILSNIDLDESRRGMRPHAPTGTCGQCTRCIDVCPTGALGDVGNGRDHSLHLDSRLCISYLTIENRKSIDLNLRKKIGNWVFGCDLCQEICPYNNIKNKKNIETDWEEFKSDKGIGHYVRLKDVLSVKSNEEFKIKFGHTAIMRAKREGLIRNACIVAKNNGSGEALECVEKLLEYESSPVIHLTAKWALGIDS